MARKTTKTKYPDRMHTIGVRCTGKQKNDIVAYSEKIDVSVNQLMLYAIWDFMRNQKGISSPGSPQFSVSTLEDVITAYARGEKLLQPCGEQQCEQVISNISGMEFCTTCNYRIG